MSVLDAHNVRIVGSGNQIVVLGHGFGTDQSSWKHLVPHLVEDYRVVMFDLMGSGTTDPENFNLQRYSTLHGYADDLLAILEELEIETCIYVGHSVSGMVGCLASLERPEAFSKIVLVSASPRYLNDSNYFGGFEQEDLNQLFEAIQSNFKAWVTGFAPLAVGADMESPVVQEFSRTLFNIRPDIALSVVKTIFQSDERAVLPRVTVPCHILQSTKDLAVPVVVAHYLQRSLGGETYVEIFPTEGHLPQLSSPEIDRPLIQKLKPVLLARRCLISLALERAGMPLSSSPSSSRHKLEYVLYTMSWRRSEWEQCNWPAKRVGPHRVLTRERRIIR